MTWTILRPVTFFENMAADRRGAGFARMWERMGERKKLQLVATADVGWFGARAFLRRGEWSGRAVTIVGDELTQMEAERVHAEVLGRGMVLAPCLIGSAVKFVLRDTVGDMFKWFEYVGYGGDVQECREMYPEMQDYRTWLVKSSPWAQEAQKRLEA